jgi:hypothetical protein
MSKADLERAYATVQYMRNHRSTAGVSDPVAYDLLNILIEELLEQKGTDVRTFQEELTGQRRRRDEVAPVDASAAQPSKSLSKKSA